MTIRSWSVAALAGAAIAAFADRAEADTLINFQAGPAVIPRAVHGVGGHDPRRGRHILQGAEPELHAGDPGVLTQAGVSGRFRGLGRRPVDRPGRLRRGRGPAVPGGVRHLGRVAGLRLDPAGGGQLPVASAPCRSSSRRSSGRSSAAQWLVNGRPVFADNLRFTPNAVPGPGALALTSLALPFGLVIRRLGRRRDL